MVDRNRPSRRCRSAEIVPQRPVPAYTCSMYYKLSSLVESSWIEFRLKLNE